MLATRKKQAALAVTMLCMPAESMWGHVIMDASLQKKKEKKKIYTAISLDQCGSQRFHGVF